MCALVPPLLRFGHRADRFPSHRTDYFFHDDLALRFSLLVVLRPVVAVGFFVCAMEQSGYRNLRLTLISIITPQEPA